MMEPDLLVRVFTVLALLVLATGSTIITVAFLGGTPNPKTPYDLGIGAGYAIALIWPAVVCVVWVLGAVALLIQRRVVSATFLLLMVVGVYVLVQRMLYLIASMSGGRFPKRGLPAVLVVLIFLALNVGSIYFGWRYILRGGTDALLP